MEEFGEVELETIKGIGCPSGHLINVIDSNSCLIIEVGETWQFFDRKEEEKRIGEICGCKCVIINGGIAAVLHDRG